MTTRSAPPTSSRAAQGLIVTSLVLVLVLVAVSASSLWSDGGGMIISLYGVPLACAGLLALGVGRADADYLASLVVVALAVVSLAWSLLGSMAASLFSPVPSLLLLVAALASWHHRRTEASARAG